MKRNLEDKITVAINALNESGQKKAMNLTDPDAPIMKGKKGNFDTFYNAQIGCNENDLIGYCDVVIAGNDKAQLKPTIEGIEENTGQSVETMLADADYGTYDSFEFMDKKNIEAYVPFRNMDTTYEDAPYHSSHFKYQSETDSYICPNNEELKFRKIREDKQRNQKFKEYRTDACKSCAFQKQCCPKKAARRVISREQRQNLKDEIKKRLNSEDGKKVYQRRLHPVESIFGQLKFNLGYACFLLRGLEYVKAEFAIMCLSHNLLKMANHSSLVLKYVRHKSNIWLIWHFKAFMRIVTWHEKPRGNLPVKPYVPICHRLRLIDGQPVWLWIEKVTIR